MHASGVLHAFIASFLALPSVAATTKAPKWMDQSWFFDWTPPGAPIPIPTTAQCETIHIIWSRQTATGPDPVSPYYLQIYTSSFIFPFIVPAGSNPETYLTVPFVPGTQYEICMFDANNSTGGCQAIYTVYPNTTTSTPSCANLTMPAKAMNVLSEASQGTLSQYGWVDSVENLCSDIRVTPKEGTPPFTFTVAPALHPPLNITSNDMSPINWTVSLSWGLPFFISLVDSTGLSWSNGPIHAGKGDTSCFSSKSQSGPSVGATIGSAVAGVVFGGLVSLLAVFLFTRRRRRSHPRGEAQKARPYYTPYSPQSENEELPAGRYSAIPSQSSPSGHTHELLPSLPGTLHEFRVEPFVPGPSHSARSRSAGSGSIRAQASGQSLNDGNEAQTHARTPASPSTPAGNQVYVIHHDSGRAPVSVVTSQGTEVVELPPGYSSSYLPPSSPGREQGNPTPPPPRRQGKSAVSSRSPAQRSS